MSAPEHRPPLRRRRGDPGLWPLRELKNYDVMSGDPDVRGWPVVLDGTGVAIGRVEELIVDMPASRVAYLDLALDATSLVDQRHGRVRTADVRVDRQQHHVIVPDLSVLELGAVTLGLDDVGA